MRKVPISRGGRELCPGQGQDASAARPEAHHQAEDIPCASLEPRSSKLAFLPRISRRYLPAGTAQLIFRAADEWPKQDFCCVQFPPGFAAQQPPCVESPAPPPALHLLRERASGN